MLTSKHGCIGEAARASARQHHATPLGLPPSAGVRRPGPLTKKPFYLTDTVPPGPKQAQEAKKLRTRFLNQVDEGRNAKTRATVTQLIEKYFEVVDVEVEILDSFYAELRGCRQHCDYTKFTQHRATRSHQCDELEGNQCPRNNP